MDSFNGSANKNVGDAFLLVWKIPEGKIIPLEDDELKVLDRSAVESIADLALLAFVKIIIRVKISEKVNVYNKTKKLL